MSTDSIQKSETHVVKPERIRGGPTYLPAVDMVEAQDKLLLMADVPGVTSDDLDIRYERGQLTIHGRVAPRQDPNTSYLLREYGVGDFYRVFEVGEGIDSSKIDAELRDGVLTLHLPKVQELMPRKITVKTN
jgi:HSP20 family protein